MGEIGSQRGAGEQGDDEGERHEMTRTHLSRVFLQHPHLVDAIFEILAGQLGKRRPAVIFDLEAGGQQDFPAGFAQPEIVFVVLVALQLFVEETIFFERPAAVDRKGDGVGRDHAARRARQAGSAAPPTPKPELMAAAIASARGPLPRVSSRPPTPAASGCSRSSSIAVSR